MEKVIVIKKGSLYDDDYARIIHIVKVDTDKDIETLKAEYNLEVKKRKLNTIHKSINIKEYTLMDYIDEFYRYKELEFSEYVDTEE